MVYRLSRRRGLQHADAEDLCQGVFAAVSQAVESWEPRDNGPRFRNWLSRVARNAILNAITRRQPDQATGSSSVHELLLEAPASKDINAAILQEGRMEAFRWAAQQVQSEFQESTWTMFHETIIFGRSVPGVAASLGCTTGAVYVARCRVMRRIKDRLSEVSDFWSEES